MKTVDFFAQEKKSMSLLGSLVRKLGGFMEIVFILLIWFAIFFYSDLLGGFGLSDMVAYLLIGNLIGLFTSFLLSKTIKFNIGHGDFKMFHYRPIFYILRVFSRTLKKIILPFFLSISLNITLLYFFVDSLYFNHDIRYLALIATIIILAFVTELLLALLIDLHVFWSFESRDFFKLIMRLKKILAGAYFPLNLFGAGLLTVSLLFPFAYSFYVPTQLYLKNMSYEQGLMGLSVQLIWIAILYFIIKISWRKKIENNKETLKREAVL
ncbi:hypothetical protein C0584_04215 [Candidatus Parcubacteria bacterium]|nr:MAG: hypothetical protein C0584_04215 [Candidatus Parcubacteria bacterium]